LHPSKTKFGHWVEDMGFKDIDINTRTDAMWLASHWSEAEGIRLEDLLIHSDGESKTLTHPKNIRQHFNDYVRKVSAPPELADLTITEKPTVTLDQRSAEKLAKLINRSTSGDEGSETAKRHVESIAKKHGVSSEVLKEVVSHAGPWVHTLGTQNADPAQAPVT
jgi:hypothetical protein